MYPAQHKLQILSPLRVLFWNPALVKSLAPAQFQPSSELAAATGKSNVHMAKLVRDRIRQLRPRSKSNKNISKGSLAGVLPVLAWGSMGQDLATPSILTSFFALRGSNSQYSKLVGGVCGAAKMTASRVSGRGSSAAFVCVHGVELCAIKIHGFPSPGPWLGLCFVLLCRCAVLPLG
ncbi:hypothetical protein CGCF415_v002659 [Colletotrichum fructicola]|nr:hypothetical protein CGCFRS4_v002077 [Colletotrichum fructicola]KAF4913633.1 hypothetical protein CGCF415_v002659 [Colletotrichum fructicola]KAF4936552.1 hypothetical protein CGCF245_v006519 [Colletotrichum fructicola]